MRNCDTFSPGDAESPAKPHGLLTRGIASPNAKTRHAPVIGGVYHKRIGNAGGSSRSADKNCSKRHGRLRTRKILGGTPKPPAPAIRKTSGSDVSSEFPGDLSVLLKTDFSPRVTLDSSWAGEAAMRILLDLGMIRVGIMNHVRMGA